ncbi:MAG: SHOCT domain-containing protein [Chloroflexi bacterium]|nr:SHOCT domain-containing protein [Chloroflexota bacterium]
MFGNYGWGMMGGWGGMLVMLLFWVALILIIVWVVRAAIGTNSGSGSASNARAILDARYARGEITRKEYEQMKKDIGA